jgi:hypothetical protein
MCTTLEGGNAIWRHFLKKKVASVGGYKKEYKTSAESIDRLQLTSNDPISRERHT